jgi:SAM-dependent methyltransferase
VHVSVISWVAAQVIQWDLSRKSTLEVGSLNVNGSVRSLFAGAYCGVDRQEGPGVDVVMDAEALTMPDDTFEVVVSTEMLEHCLHPWKAMAEMVRVLQPGGTILVTARGFDERGAFPFHEYPHDCNRFSPQGALAMAEEAGMLVKGLVADWESPGYFIIGTK